MTSAVAQLRERFQIDEQFHKRVYLFTYAFARPEGQRALRSRLYCCKADLKRWTWRLNIGNYY
jgi:hypothetical protein